MQTSPFSDLPSASLGGADAPPATNAEKLFDDIVGETGAEARTGDARTFNDSQNPAGDMQDRDKASQPSAIPQFATSYPGSLLLTAMALGFLLGRAVSRR